MSKITNEFRREWEDWRKLLGALAESSSSILICPDQWHIKFIEEEQDGVEVLKISLPFPICFYSVPEKQKNNGTHLSGKKMAIFIDGTFELIIANDSAQLRNISSLAAFYRIRSGEGGNKSLELADAYHFDFFKEDVKKSSPHPIFHAQRSIRLTATGGFKETLAQKTVTSKVDITEVTVEDKGELFDLGSFRIPTPQMDLLNLGAAIAGNQLVGSGNSAQWNHFNKLLSNLHDPHNDLHSIQIPNGHNAKIFTPPRKHLADWYSFP